MLKPGIKSRNKFNMSKKNYILERKLSHHFNNIYINDNKEQNSSNNSSKKEFDNELLIKSLKKKSKKKNNLKDLLFNKRNINTNTNKERKNLIISKSKKNDYFSAIISRLRCSMPSYCSSPLSSVRHGR